MTQARKSSTRARQTPIQSLDDLQPDPSTPTAGRIGPARPCGAACARTARGRSIVIDKRGRILGGTRPWNRPSTWGSRSRWCPPAARHSSWCSGWIWMRGPTPVPGTGAVRQPGRRTRPGLGSGRAAAARTGGRGPGGLLDPRRSSPGCSPRRGLRRRPTRTPCWPRPPRSGAATWFQLGRHRLACGDATSATDVTRLLAGAAPRLMVTESPLRRELSAGVSTHGLCALPRRCRLRVARGIVCRRGDGGPPAGSVRGLEPDHLGQAHVRAGPRRVPLATRTGGGSPSGRGAPPRGTAAGRRAPCGRCPT